MYIAVHSSCTRGQCIFQEKRSLFPRFYFIGDDDLLEILGQSTNPNVIQTHLKKLFAGIHSVEFDEAYEHITAMKSLDGEVVPFRRKIKIQSEVEVCVLTIDNRSVKLDVSIVKFCCLYCGVHMNFISCYRYGWGKSPMR